QPPAQAADQAKHGNRLSAISAASSVLAFSLLEEHPALLAAYRMAHGLAITRRDCDRAGSGSRFPARSAGG
ncbi:MAG: hypothetical protein ABW318_10150, partial [Vicinamibacterales bacterium]